MAGAKRNTKVVAYRLDGTLFRVYDSARKAALSRHAHPRSIDKCIRGETLSAFNYMWRRYPSDDIPNQIEPYKAKEISLSKSPIALIDENGEIVHHYPSIKQASIDNNVDPSSIRDMLRGRCKTSKGKRYRYLSNEEITQFGYDDIRQINIKTKPVIQYNLDGEYVRTYPSIRNASISLNKSPQGIRDCLTGKYNTAYGYVWKYKNEDNVRRKQIYVYVYDSKGKIIKKYKSVKEASIDMNISVSSINNTIRGRQKTCRGYIFKKK